MNEILQNRGIFFIAEAFYFSAFVLSVFCVLRRGMFQNLAPIATGVLLCGWVLQLVGLYLRGAEAGVLPLRNTFEFLQTLGWSAVFAMGVLRVVWSMRVPVVLTGGLAFVLSGLGLANVCVWDVFSEVSEKNPWVSAHALLAIVGYAFWTASALVFIAYFLQDRALRERIANRFYALLPDLASLDRVAGRLVACGIVALGASVVMGMLNLFEGNTLAPLFVAYKVAVSCLLICGNGWLIYLRRKNSITGRSFARLGLVVFIVGVFLLGGFTCVKTATDAAQDAGVATPAVTEDVGNVR